MSDLIYIADFTEIDRDILLEYLWGFSIQIDNIYHIFDIQIAKNQILINKGYANNVCGKTIDLYLYNSDTINPYLYDFHNGIGSVQEIVNYIREEKKFNSENNINLLALTIKTMNI